MFLFSDTNNGYNIANIHCIDLEVVFLDPEEHFAHFILKNLSLAKKMALLTKTHRCIASLSDSSIQFITTSMNLTHLCMSLCTKGNPFGGQQHV